MLKNLLSFTAQIKFVPMEASTIYSTPVKTERLTPKDLVRKHIADPTHKITTEEFDNLIVGVFASKDLDNDKESQ